MSTPLAASSKDQDSKISTDGNDPTGVSNTSTSTIADDVKKEVTADLNLFKETSLNFRSSFTAGALIELSTMKFDVPAKKIFQTCWQNVIDYE